MYSTYFKSAIAATLFASANAHFFIKTPTPIPGNAIKDPLDGSGSNFPCHGADVTQGDVTSLKAGSTFNLEYELGGNPGVNTAVHGGGSCQVSLTYETDAAKLKDPANWKVIQSFVGGCPTDAPGNLGDAVTMCTGSNGPGCVNPLSFKVPAEVKSGAAVMAWTWFNNVGNREMYMNCAKVSISGGSDSMDSLPAMFVANLKSINQCKTTEKFNTQFPNPGANVITESPLNFPVQAPGGNCPAGSGSAAPADPADPADPASPAAPASPASSAAPASSAGSGTGSYTTSVVATSSAANDGQYTGIGAATKSAAAPKATQPAANNPGGIFAPGASTAVASDSAPTATSVVATTFVTAASPAATTPAASTPAASAPAVASPAAPASSPATSGSCPSGQVACTASGFYCIDASTFGMCAFGCAAPRKMSSGTDCSNGAVVHTIAHQKRRKQIRNVHRRYADGSF